MIESFDDLLRLVAEADFPGLCDALRDTPDLRPGDGSVITSSG